MRIAYIGSRGFPGFAAGVEKSLEELCPRLVSNGHEVVLYCSDRVSTQDSTYKGVLLKRIPAFHTKHLETVSRTFLSALDALTKDYDVIHFQSIGPALLSWMGRFSRSGAKILVTVHGLDWQRAKWGAVAKQCLIFGEKSAVWYPHATVVVSKHLVRYYKERYGKDVIYIPNGVNLHEPLPPRMIKEKWGIGNRDYFLFASRLVPEKGCHTLIEAFRGLSTDKQLVIAGESWHSDDYVGKLKQMAQGDDRIRFVGWAEGELLRELFSNAYVYCLPSEIEGLSLSLLEGMSYGVCPLVSHIPENTDVTEEGGMTFEVRNSSDLRQKMDKLLRDTDLVTRTGYLARQIVEREYNWDKAAGSLERLYAGLASGKK